jgi:biotin-(acetyl-CoA carboxylase) ligase
VRVERSHDVIIGRAESVDEFGQLVVRADDVVHVISVGDVVHVRAHESTVP